MQCKPEENELFQVGFESTAFSVPGQVFYHWAIYMYAMIQLSVSLMCSTYMYFLQFPRAHS